MIELSTHDGRRVFLAPAAIAEIHEAGASSQWHGIMAFVTTFDGNTLEVRQTAKEVAESIRKLKEQTP